MVVDEAVDHLWEPEKNESKKNKDGDTTMVHWNIGFWEMHNRHIGLNCLNNNESLSRQIREGQENMGLISLRDFIMDEAF